ncbi:MAG: phospholipase [Pseudomonadota bacterium]|nr:phospholipase [Pseudomonadota bacterium]
MNKQLILTGTIISALALASAFAAPAAHAASSNADPGSRAATPTTLSAKNTYKRSATLGKGQGVAEHRFRLDLPAGASLQALPAESGQNELASEILVVDRDGNTLGVVDSAWAQDAGGKSLFTYFRIDGDTLVQSVDTSDAASGPITAVLMYAGIDVDPDAAFVDAPADSGEISPSAVSFVSVPWNYVYAPWRGSLHDYCTASPDEFPNPAGPNANFRGPCARHDMCYAGTTSAWTCDVNLRENMRINCRYTYAWYNPTRAVCYSTADVYFAAVVLHTGS